MCKFKKEKKRDTVIYNVNWINIQVESEANWYHHCCFQCTFSYRPVANWINLRSLCACAVAIFGTGVHAHNAKVGFYSGQKRCSSTGWIRGLVILVVGLKLTEILNVDWITIKKSFGIKIRFILMLWKIMIIYVSFYYRNKQQIYASMVRFDMFSHIVISRQRQKILFHINSNDEMLILTYNHSLINVLLRNGNTSTCNCEYNPRQGSLRSVGWFM